MKVMGKALIKANGRVLDTLPGASLDIGGVTRETVTGDNRVIGQKSTPRPSKIEFEIAVTRQTRLADIARWEDVVVTVEADTGQTWVVPSAWTTEPPTTTTSDGKAKVVMEGLPAEEMTA